MPPSGSRRGEKEASNSTPRRKRANTVTSTPADDVQDNTAQTLPSRRTAGQLQAIAASASSPNVGQSLGSREMLAEALEPVQVRRPSVPSGRAEEGQQQRSLRHASSSISKLPSLKRISEAEPASLDPERKSRRSLNSSRSPSTLPNRAQQPPRHPSSNEDLYRTLPRGFDPATGRVRDDRQTRGTVPYIFSEQSPQVSPSKFPKPPSQFPNPHGTIYRRGYQMSTAQLQRQASGSSFPTHMRGHGQHPADQQIPPTPPLGLAAPFGSPRGPTVGQLQAQAQAQRAMAGYQSRTLPFSVDYSSAAQGSAHASEWSSEGSTPTPTASSIAAAKVRNEKLQAELVPIQLIHPSAFTTPAINPVPQAIQTPVQQSTATFSRNQSNQQTPQKVTLSPGEGTAGRRAFQDFVAAGGLQALSIRDGGRQNPNGSTYEGSVTVGDALGRNYVDKLGDIAFGESALSRPVTRGMIDNLLEEKEEQEMRGRFVSDHKPWAPDMEDESEKVSMVRNNTRISMDKKPSADHRLSQLTLNDGAGTVLHNIDLDEPVEKADIDPADFDSISGDTALDELEYLADRWPLWRKFGHLFVLCVYIFAMQALGAGYLSAIPSLAAAFRQSESLTKLLGLGLLAYNGSQGGGFLFGCAFLGFGRQRLFLISLVLAGAFSVIAGFSKTVFVTLVLQAGLGQVAGFSLLLTLATMVDLFTTYTTRLSALIMMAFAAAAGQFAGPWIAQLILAHIPWTWLYWIMLIVAVALIVAVGLLCPETNPSILFRRRTLALRRTGGVWTPEAQPVATLRQVLREDALRPFRVFFSSWLIPALSIFVFMEGGIVTVFTASHGLSSSNGALASTVGGLIGLLAAIAMLFVINCRHSIEPDMRLLHIDEKGYIDTTKSERKVEKVLVGALVGSALFSLSMYTLALTAVPSTSWIFSAFGVILHTAGVIMVSVSALQYVLDAFTPARPIELRDVIAREEDDPYTPLRETDTSSQQQTRDKRWTNETAITVTISNVVSYPAQYAFASLSFQAFAVIYASVALLFTGGFVLVYLYGRNARIAALHRLDVREKARNKPKDDKSSTHASRPGSRRELYLGRIVAARNGMDFDEVRPLTPVVQRDWRAHEREEAQAGLMASMPAGQAQRQADPMGRFQRWP